MVLQRLLGPCGKLPILIRDDDTKFSQTNMLESIYSKAWKDGYKVYLVIVPFQRGTNDICVPLYGRANQIRNIRIVRTGSKISIESDAYIVNFSFRARHHLEPNNSVLFDEETSIISIEDLFPEKKLYSMKKASLNDVKICYSNGFPFLYSDGKPN